jgi:Protein of unknown function (DUF1588)
MDVIQAGCVACHKSTGAAKGSDLIFTNGDSKTEAENLAKLNTFVINESPMRVLNKVKGLDSHGGGDIYGPTAPEYIYLTNYLSELSGQNLTALAQVKSTLTLESPDATYRRASLLLTGQIPSAQILTSMRQSDENTLRKSLTSLLEADGFKDFIKRGANDQLLVRSLFVTKDYLDNLIFYYPVFYNKFQTIDPLTQQVSSDYKYSDAVLDEIAEAPLELIAHVVQTNLPYTEVITAPYTMVSEKTAEIYKTGLSPLPGQFLPAQNHGQHVSTGPRPQPRYDWDASVEVAIPHAGVLSEPGFLRQYPTTATNRNRARARWTYQHFLGVDIENSAARTIDSAALADSDNPTLNNAACSVCHVRVDPLAGAFQNFGESGTFREQNGGLNSLDPAYRRTKLYKTGDLWYADMRPAGFEQTQSTDGTNSLNQAAQLIAKDPRFAAGTVKFWWPAIFGESLLDDTIASAQYDAKLTALNYFADFFTKNNYKLKPLIVEMLMSDWFRGQLAAQEATESPAIYTGGKRLLTPEELYNKTNVLTGVADPNLLNGLKLNFGGIDSVSAVHRQRDLSNVMLRVAERHALSKSCTIVATEFNKPKEERKLFTLVERQSLPSSALKTIQIFDQTTVRQLSWSITVSAAPDQLINFVATQSLSVQADPALDTVTLSQLQIIKPDGSVLVNGAVGDMDAQFEWIKGNPLNGRANPFNIRKYNSLKMNIPVDQSGVWQIKINATAQTAGNQLEISVEPSILVANAKDTITQNFRTQVASLIERLHGKSFAENSEEVIRYTDLFIRLRQNKINRNSGNALTETNVSCDYNSNGVPWNQWAADPTGSLSAWRTLLTALMTDYNYINE